MKARLRTETWRRLRLIAQAENLRGPLEALDRVVEIASEKLYEADTKKRATAAKKRDEKRAKDATK